MHLREDSKHYIVYEAEEESLSEMTREKFLTMPNTHWGIESLWHLSIYG
jgi:hypothetical protein